ncbi:sensor histidine kinase [Calderihabitans maritimus]|uniref:histidine kinase n=1 Tax=Calderihabitans maritimus TaxID=1246530 RepID=A0A1Z5HVB4_9FIRM|nr:ATP-binding protein [Calderihabitans maritimus]GAW93271.1 integral membrane sensor signal transduction histidine kinase [Calderihabitans maritimus]
MNLVYEAVKLHFPLIYFVYGLVYFMMGFAILIKNKNGSNFILARPLWLLGIFGLLHGLADWTPAFLPIWREIYRPETILQLRIGAHVLLAFSYLALFFFGVRLLIHTLGLSRWLEAVPVTLFIIWSVSVVTLYGVLSDPVDWMCRMSALARYMLGFPAAMLSAYGLYLQVAELKKLQMPFLTESMRWASIYFAAYGFLTGLIVPKSNFFPASWLNYESFMAVTGLPVQFFRLICGIGISFCIIRILKIFDVESRKRIEEAETRHAILKERERISREIHDGTIQSLYGIGLRLEHCKNLLAKGEKVQAALSHLNFSINKLNETIRDIRHYIMDLPNYYFRDTQLRQELQDLVAEFAVTSTVAPDLIVEETDSRELTPFQRNQLYHIAREALANIQKHARASKAEIRVRLGPEQVEMKIIDNGKGFNVDEVLTRAEQEGKQGLKNIARRVKSLKGTLRIVSSEGQGTEIEITIPYWREENGTAKTHAG